MESSVGCHSIEVIGALCQLNAATGDGSADADLINHIQVSFQCFECIKMKAKNGEDGGRMMMMMMGDGKDREMGWHRTLSS